MTTDALTKPIAKLLDASVSLFPNVALPDNVQKTTVREVLRDIASDKYRPQIEAVREAYASPAGKEAADRLKKRTLPAIAFSGTFQRRENAALVLPSGLLGLDFDALCDRLLEARRTLQADSHVISVNASPSGTGLKVLVPCNATDNASNHACFKVAAEYFAQLGLVADPACKDVSRLCFVSWDPDCWIAGGEGGRRAVALFTAPLTAICNPAPCTLQSTLYTTAGKDERVLLARARAGAKRYRNGNLLLSVAPDLANELAAKLLADAYRNEMQYFGSGAQRTRWADWLPHVAAFDDDELKHGGTKARAFTAYRRIINGIKFERRKTPFEKLIAPD